MKEQEKISSYSKESRIEFARRSISQAKYDLKKLAALDEVMLGLVFQLEWIQREFRKYYSKRVTP